MSAIAVDLSPIYAVNPAKIPEKAKIEATILPTSQESSIPGANPMHPLAPGFKSDLISVDAQLGNAMGTGL